MVMGILDDAPSGLAGVLPRSGVGDFGILVDGADHGCHPGLSASGDPSEQVGHEVGAAPLPVGPAEDCGDGAAESLMSVRDHQLHPTETPGGQRA